MKSHNRWIITKHNYTEYKSLEKALAWMEFLKSTQPDQFFMYRIKRSGHEPACPAADNWKLSRTMRCECPMGLFEARSESVPTYTGSIAAVAEAMATS